MSAATPTSSYLHNTTIASNYSGTPYGPLREVSRQHPCRICEGVAWPLPDGPCACVCGRDTWGRLGQGQAALPVGLVLRGVVPDERRCPRCGGQAPEQSEMPDRCTCLHDRYGYVRDPETSTVHETRCGTCGRETSLCTCTPEELRDHGAREAEKQSRYRADVPPAPESTRPPRSTDPLLGDEVPTYSVFSSDGRFTFSTLLVMDAPIANHTAPDGRTLYVYTNPGYSPRIPGGGAAEPDHGLAEQLQAARAEQARLRADLAAALTRAEALEGTTLAAAMQRADRLDRGLRSVIRVIEAVSLTPTNRIAALGALDLAGALRNPDSGPRHIDLGTLADRCDISPKRLAHDLKAAHEQGLLVRREIKLQPGETGGEFRTEVSVGPGDGVPLALWVDDAREDDRQRKARTSRQDKEERAALEQKVAVLEAVAERVMRSGCPLCGGDMVATGYCCCSCGHTFTAAEVADYPEVREDGTVSPVPPPPGIRVSIYRDPCPPDSGGRCEEVSPEPLDSGAATRPLDGLSHHPPESGGREPENPRPTYACPECGKNAWVFLAGDLARWWCGACWYAPPPSQPAQHSRKAVPTEAPSFLEGLEQEADLAYPVPSTVVCP